MVHVVRSGLVALWCPCDLVFWIVLVALLKLFRLSVITAEAVSPLERVETLLLMVLVVQWLSLLVVQVLLTV